MQHAVMIYGLGKSYAPYTRPVIFNWGCWKPFQREYENVKNDIFSTHCSRFLAHQVEFEMITVIFATCI
jgi:hypothetical protein